MRVVLDTNVLVSGTVFGGPPGELITLAGEGDIELVLSPALLDEFRGVLRTRFHGSDRALFRTETLLRDHSVVVEPAERITAVPDDPDDNRILEAALEGRADLIVSGDHHLLSLKQFSGIPIVTPRQALARIRRR
ncbi:MAG: putative toxin-antitoxin system toxin component, PIN family [bacterium]